MFICLLNICKVQERAIRSYVCMLLCVHVGLSTEARQVFCSWSIFEEYCEYLFPCSKITIFTLGTDPVIIAFHLLLFFSRGFLTLLLWGRKAGGYAFVSKLLYSSLLTLTVSRAVLNYMSARLKSEKRSSETVSTNIIGKTFHSS